MTERTNQKIIEYADKVITVSPVTFSPKQKRLMITMIKEIVQEIGQELIKEKYPEIEQTQSEMLEIKKIWQELNSKLS